MSWAEEQDWFGLEDMALEARQRSADAMELIEHGYWLQKDLVPIALTSMSDRHIENCIRMIEDGRLSRPFALPYLKAEQSRRARQKPPKNMRKKRKK